MKRAISFILAVLLCTGLCACGEEPATDQGITPATGSIEKPPISVDAKDVAGTYKSRLWFLDHTITLNENGDSAFGEEAGYFTYAEPSISILAKDGSSTRNFLVENNCIYTCDFWQFDADIDSGVTFSPNEKGYTNQAFEGRTPGGKIPGCDYDWILLDLNDDGTYVLQLGNQTETTPEVKETFEGTYTTGKYILTLTYQGKDYTLVTSNANYIYFCIYDKV